MFIDLQREAKVTASVGDIYRRLIHKTNNVIKAFKRRTFSKDQGIKELTDLLSLNLGPSKWF